MRIGQKAYFFSVTNLKSLKLSARNSFNVPKRETKCYKYSFDFVSTTTFRSAPSIWMLLEKVTFHRQLALAIPTPHHLIWFHVIITVLQEVKQEVITISMTLSHVLSKRTATSFVCHSKKISKVLIKVIIDNFLRI